MLARTGNAILTRTGRRGLFLAFCAVLDLLYGYSLLTTPAPQLGYDLLLPPDAWAWLWIAAGVLAVVGVFVRADRVPYAAQAAVLGGWGLLGVHLWLIQHEPRGWVAVVIFLSFAVTVLVVAGWPEQPRFIQPPEPDPHPWQTP